MTIRYLYIYIYLLALVARLGGDEPAKEEEAAFRLVPRELVSLKQQRINSIRTQISPLIPDL